MRKIVRSEELAPKKKVQALLDFVNESGISIPEQPKPLKPVRREDIRVVCWTAVSLVPDQRSLEGST